MTSVTKQYIDFDDLAAVIVTCKPCGASLSLRIDSDRMALPYQCPSCQAAWNPMQSGGIGSQVSIFRDALKNLKGTISRQSEVPNLTMQIEIKSASLDADVPAKRS
jgi:predicted RNA-binding Zn-ribbon protein involved in translation (DUF1610 family)